MTCSSSWRRRLRGAALTGAMLALATASTVPGGTAHAEPARLTLRWTAPDGCPDGRAVSAEVDRLLGPGTAESRTPLAVSAVVSLDEPIPPGDVSRPPGRFRVRLETTSQGAVRVQEIRGATCTAIARAAALVVAMMIDPSAVVAARPPVPGTTASFPPPGAPAPPTSPEPFHGGAAGGPPAEPPAEPSRPPPSAATGSSDGRGAPLSFRIRAWAGADVGSLPGIAAGLGAAAALLYGPQRFELGASLWPNRSTNVTPQAGGSVNLLAGSAATCRDLLGGRFELGPCVAVEVGRMQATGFGVSAPGEASELWVAVKGGGAFGWAPAPRVSLALRLDAAVPLLRPRYVLVGIGPVHRAAPVVGRAEAGVEVRF